MHLLLVPSTCKYPPRHRSEFEGCVLSSAEKRDSDNAQSGFLFDPLPLLPFLLLHPWPPVRLGSVATARTYSKPTACDLTKNLPQAALFGATTQHSHLRFTRKALAIWHLARHLLDERSLLATNERAICRTFCLHPQL